MFPFMPVSILISSRFFIRGGRNKEKWSCASTMKRMSTIRTHTSACPVQAGPECDSLAGIHQGSTGGGPCSFSHPMRSVSERIFDD
jgi:hypothetical protein